MEKYDVSDTIIVALISGGVTLIGTMITVFTNALKTRKQSNERLDKIESKLDAHIKEEEWANAKQCRIRILRFNDEICEGKLHSENHYEEVLEDIDNYEAFCAAHPDYHNNKGVIAMVNIKSKYVEHKNNNDFLQ